MLTEGQISRPYVPLTEFPAKDYRPITLMFGSVSPMQFIPTRHGQLHDYLSSRSAPLSSGRKPESSEAVSGFTRVATTFGSSRRFFLITVLRFPAHSVPPWIILPMTPGGGQKLR